MSRVHRIVIASVLPGGAYDVAGSVAAQAPTIRRDDIVDLALPNGMHAFGLWPCTCLQATTHAVVIGHAATLRHTDAVAYFQAAADELDNAVDLRLQLSHFDEGLRRLFGELDERPDYYTLVLCRTHGARERFLEARLALDYAPYATIVVGIETTERQASAAARMKTAIDAKVAPSTHVLLLVDKNAFYDDEVLFERLTRSCVQWWGIREYVRWFRVRDLRRTRDTRFGTRLSIPSSSVAVIMSCSWDSVEATLEKWKREIGATLFSCIVAGLDSCFEMYSAAQQRELLYVSPCDLSVVGLHRRLVDVAIALAPVLNTYALLFVVERLSGMQYLRRSTIVAVLHRIVRRAHAAGAIGTLIAGRTRSNQRRRLAAQDAALAEE